MAVNPHRPRPDQTSNSPPPDPRLDLRRRVGHLSNMTQVTVEELKHHLGRYLKAVEAGEILEVRRRRCVIAWVVPHTASEPAEPWPDLMERLARIYPGGPIAESDTEMLYRDRDRGDSNTSACAT